MRMQAMCVCVPKLFSTDSVEMLSILCAVSFAIGENVATTREKEKRAEQIAWLLALRVIQICVIISHTTARFFRVRHLVENIFLGILAFRLCIDSRAWHNIDCAGVVVD